MTELERGVEVSFADFLAGAFEHDQIGCVTDINDIQITVRHLRMSRIGDELTVDPANAGRADWTFPRNVADHKRSRSANESEHVGIVFTVRAQHDALDLDLIVPSFGKERPDGPVD